MSAARTLPRALGIVAIFTLVGPLAAVAIFYLAVAGTDASLLGLPAFRRGAPALIVMALPVALLAGLIFAAFALALGWTKLRHAWLAALIADLALLALQLALEPRWLSSFEGGGAFARIAVLLLLWLVLPSLAAAGIAWRLTRPLRMIR